jgi:hypothetical protein
MQNRQPSDQRTTCAAQRLAVAEVLCQHVLARRDVNRKQLVAAAQPRRGGVGVGGPSTAQRTGFSPPSALSTAGHRRLSFTS